MQVSLIRNQAIGGQTVPGLVSLQNLTGGFCMLSITLHFEGGKKGVPISLTRDDMMALADMLRSVATCSDGEKEFDDAVACVPPEPVDAGVDGSSVGRGDSWTPQGDVAG